MSCVLWDGRVRELGYGLVYNHDLGRDEHAHRAAYRDHYGEIPDGHHIHHACGTKLCVNPDHLQALMAREHGWLHGRESDTEYNCGHPRSEENTYTYPRGVEECRACREEHLVTYDRERGGTCDRCRKWYADIWQHQNKRKTPCRSTTDEPTGGEDGPD